MKKILFLFLITSLTLSACGTKKTVTQATPTPVPRELTITDNQKPTINLTSREDGHELTLIISKVDPIFTKIEYELIYTASDAGIEIEKGVSGNVESKDYVNGVAQRKILLGTESCTSGCKYKYDAGVNGGNLNLTMITKDNQVASLEIPFTLAQVKGKGFTVTFTK